MLGPEQLGGELRRTVDSWSPDGEIGLESAAGLVSGLEVLRLQGMRWVVVKVLGGSLVLRHTAYC